MRTCITPALSLILAMATTVDAGDVRATYRSALAAAITQRVQMQWKDLDSYYVDLHSHPELSLQEKKTSVNIAERLDAVGYDVTLHVGGTGVVSIVVA